MKTWENDEIKPSRISTPSPNIMKMMAVYFVSEGHVYIHLDPN